VQARLRGERRRERLLRTLTTGSFAALGVIGFGLLAVESDTVGAVLNGLSLRGVLAWLASAFASPATAALTAMPQTFTWAAQAQDGLDFGLVVALALLAVPACYALARLLSEKRPSHRMAV
jgi:hypothetical protein